MISFIYRKGHTISMTDLNTNTIGSAYFYYRSIGIVVISIIVGVVGIALLLGDKVTVQGKILGGLLLLLAGGAVFLTYRIATKPTLRSNVGKITLVGDVVTRVLD